MSPSDSLSPSRRGRLLVLICIVALALNLRVAVGSLGVLIPEVRDHLGLTLAVTGLLTTLPVLCFSLFGAGTNSLVRVVGIHRTALLALFIITTGLFVRSVATNSPVFVVFTALALAGCAVGNVILPPLAKLHFPDHLGSVSAAYGAALMAGATIGSAVTVPASHLLGGWRGGLAIWGVLSAATFVLWLNLGRHDVKVETKSKAYGMRVTIRSPLAWAMAGFFGIQSAQAYAQFGWLPAILTDAGVSQGRAGLMLGILSSIGIPTTLALPRVMSRIGDRPVLPICFGLLSFAGWMGVLIAPTSFTIIWMVLLGMGGTAFTWVLTMMGRKTRSPDGTGALSGFVQSMGYLIAAAGPFGMGLLHDSTGTWDLGIVVMSALALVMIALGVLMWRWHSFEDTIGR